MNSEERDKQRRREMMFMAVREQMTSPESPDVKVHYDRLRSLGYTDVETLELIACCLAAYIWHTMRMDGYTYSDYVAALEKLPEIDWEEDEEDEDEDDEQL